MKKLLDRTNFLTALFFVLTFSIASATTVTVDNKTGSAAQYTDLQTAISTAQPGDTILVSSSETSYGDIIMNKKLVLIGEGYDFENKNASILNYLIIRNENPALSLDASNSHIEGFYINGTINKSSGIYRYVSLSIEGNSTKNITDVVFRRNRVTWGFHLMYFKDVFVHNNILEGDVGYAPLQNSVTGSYPFGTNLDFRNNICLDGLPRLKGSQVFDHNLFIGAKQTYDLFFGGVGITNAVSGITFTNNILWGFGTAGATSSVFSNNLVVNTENDQTFTYGNNTSNNNLENIDPKFVNASSDFTFSFSSDFNLTDTSPAKTGDTSGGQLSIYGGNFPWPSTLYLKPKGPIVTEIKPVSSPSVPAGGTLVVKFKSEIKN